MVSYDVNPLAVFLAAVASFLIGWLWHSPLLFGKTWMKLNGFTAKSMKAMHLNAVQAMVLGFVNTLVVAYVLAVFITSLDVTTVLGAATVAVLAWIGFTATTQLMPALWEGKSWQLFAIGAGYTFVSALLMSLVLVLL